MPPNTQSISSKIIEAIKQHPVLYINDVKGPTIKLQEFRQRVWKRIAEELGLESKWVRLRWKNLRDTYSRILKSRNFAPSVKRKKWIFEDDLSFLKFPYEPDYVPQCIELTDEYVEEIMTGHHENFETLFEQLESHNEEDNDFTEYLEVLEETSSDPISTPQFELVTVANQEHFKKHPKTHKNAEQKVSVQNIKVEDAKPPKVIDVSNTYGILNPDFDIENLTASGIKKEPLKKNQSLTSVSNVKKTKPGPASKTINKNFKRVNLVNATSVSNFNQLSSSFSVPSTNDRTSIELFFNSMAQTVNTMPADVQAEIKMAVCKIVTEAEVKHSSRKSVNDEQFYAPPGMIPKLILIPCNMVDKPNNK